MRFKIKEKIAGALIIVLSALSFASYADNAQIMTPNMIDIKNNEQVNITLSITDINRIFVKNQKITSIDAPSGLLNGHNDSSGSIYANINGQAPFTAFVSTNNGVHFSLLILPKSIPGQTIELIAPAIKVTKSSAKKSAPIVRHSQEAQSFEQSEPYEKTLVNLIKSVMQQKTPPGYTNISPNAFSQIPIFTVSDSVAKNSGLSQSVKAGFLGGQLAVRVLSVENNSSKPVSLIANEFYNPNVRAVSISQQYLVPQGKTFVFEVVSNV